ncbi:MAG: hypothetical protein HKN41_10575 [Ilumatobacter sp.]|nr:hypothetical protein [Ilumatobacter sp.]
MTDTQTSTLSPEEAPLGAPSQQVESAAQTAARVGLTVPASRLGRSVAIIAVLLSAFVLVAVAVAAVLPAEWVASKETSSGETVGTPFALTPASAQPVDERLRFGDDLDGVAQQFPAEGDVYFVTVTEPAQSVLSWFVGRDEPAIQFRTFVEKFGVQTPQQRQTFALESMRTSEQEAQFVALQRLGYDVMVEKGDVLIQDMVCLEGTEDGSECLRWSPSDDVLDPGDRIIEVDGEPIAIVDDLARLLEGLSPGDVVTMRIDRPEVGELTVDVELTESPTEPGRTIVGFFPFDTARVELPFDLDIDTGSIGGPSAGLAFTLTLIDALSEGELTGGVDVAVTGEIELDGSVRAIGGLRQKASAVAQAGVDVFLVPASQSEADVAAAREAAGDEVEIVLVDTLDEALAALESRGGDPLPPAEVLAAAREAGA